MNSAAAPQYGRIVFASVPAGLSPGRSGYCTAARSPGLRDRLVREIESMSSHEVGEGEAYAFNLMRVGEETYAVLTRFDDAGPDYTGRASTIAHHLIFDIGQVAALPPPADIARRYEGWVKKWVGPARELPAVEPLALAGAPADHTATEWRRLAGDARKAAAFRDAHGRAVVAKLPAPGGADTLALIAEASLTLRDRGWTTPFTTRIREPDTFAVWRAHPSVNADAIPVPEDWKRRFAPITLSRSAVKASPIFSPVKTHGAPNVVDAPEKTAPLSQKTLLIAGSALAVVIGASAIFLFGRNSSEDAPETPEPPRVVAPAEPPKDARLAHIGKLLAEGRRLDAAKAWAGALRKSPALAAQNPAVAQSLADSLVPEAAKVIRAKVNDAKAVFSSAESTALRTEIDDLAAVAAELKITVSAADTAALADAKTMLAEMASLDAAMPPRVVVGADWKEAAKTDLSVSYSSADLESPKLAAFLGAPHEKLTAVIRRFSGFGAHREKGLAYEIPERDFSPGKALTINDPEHHRLITLLLDTHGRLTVTRRCPLNAPKGFPVATDILSLELELTDTKSRESVTLTIIGDPDSALTPLRVPPAALREKGSSVSPAPWMERLILERVSTTARPSLLPNRHMRDTRNYPGLSTPASLTLQSSGTSALEAGAPWRIVILPNPVGKPVTFIRFTKL